MSDSLHTGGKVLVVGLGASGLAAASLLERLGCEPLVTDDTRTPDQCPHPLPATARFVAPAAARGALGEVTAVVVSPGVPATHALPVEASAAGLPVMSELELAARQLEAPLFAVTGTNGKSTCVSLLGDILARTDRRVFVGGNLGRPLSNAVGARYDACVVEVSSFQLEWTDRFKPQVAAVLNLSADHLDRHGDMECYADTKMRIFARADAGCRAVLGREQMWWLGRTASLAAPLSTFGSTPVGPDRPGMRFDATERRLTASDGWTAELGAGWPRAPHDFENAAAAAEMARLAGVPADAVVDAARDFTGLEHRLQLVGVCAGVEYWNDSKATNVGATVRSVEAFTRPVVLMLGGVAKGVGFEVLAGWAGSAASAGRLGHVVAYGEAGASLADALGEHVPVSRARGLAEAFGTAVGVARTGDVVLLAPACASFDEFAGYAERGTAFVRLVERLKVEGVERDGTSAS